jgi:hypothetical protein
MEIQLRPPFNLKWKKGYLVVNPENRKNIILYNSQIDRTTISYARYLYSVYLGYEVPPEFEVDHKNNDKTDDRIDNYQLLTQEQNRLKQEWWYNAMIQVWHILPCTYCHGLFYITDRDLRFRNIESICCSRSCASSLSSTIIDSSHLKNYSPKILQEDIELIKQLRIQGLSSYKIADKTGFARNTVMKYW